MNHLEFAEFESSSLNQTYFDIWYHELFVFCASNGLNFYETHPSRVKKVGNCICEEKLSRYDYSIDRIVADYENGKSVFETYSSIVLSGRTKRVWGK